MFDRQLFVMFLIAADKSWILLELFFSHTINSFVNSKVEVTSVNATKCDFKYAFELSLKTKSSNIDYE